MNIDSAVIVILLMFVLLTTNFAFSVLMLLIGDRKGIQSIKTATKLLGMTYEEFWSEVVQAKDD